LKVFISTTSFAEYDKKPLELLRSAGFEVILNPYKRKLKPEEIVALASDCDGIIAGVEQITEEVLRSLPKLKAISRCGVGLDNVDLEAAEKRGILISNTPNAPSQAVAELTIALILNLLRKVSLSDRRVRNGQWKKEMGQLISGKTVGIIGLGRIGKRVAELLKSFEVKILASEPNPDKKWVRKNKINLVSMDELLKESDIVTLHIPYTEQNRNLINSERLKIMKRGAILINTSRGGLIDEMALYQALKSGHLGGAALDVTEVEPYQGPLTELDNVIITPHIGSYAVEARIQMETEAAMNLIRMLKEGKK
jgi:D-3-phosphoglycerate dehydrogenase